MIGLMANKPIKVIRGKDVVKRSSKSKELGNKPIGVKRGKEGVSGLRKLKE